MFCNKVQYQLAELLEVEFDCLLFIEVKDEVFLLTHCTYVLQEEAPGGVQGAPSVGARGAAGAEAAPRAGPPVGGGGGPRPAHARRAHPHRRAARAMGLARQGGLSCHSYTLRQVFILYTYRLSPKKLGDF